MKSAVSSAPRSLLERALFNARCRDAAHQSVQSGYQAGFIAATQANRGQSTDVIENQIDGDFNGQGRTCPLWVISGKFRYVPTMSALVPKADMVESFAISALCQKRTFWPLFDMIDGVSKET